MSPQHFKKEHDSFQYNISILSACLALFSALSSLMLTRSFNRSVMTKSEEAIVQAKITDQWAYYQSKNIRLDILQSSTQNKISKENQKKEQDLEIKKNEIYKTARELEKQKDELNIKSQRLSDIAQFFSSAVALIQIALMLMPLTYLKESKNFFLMGAGIGGVGVLLLFAGLARFLMLAHK